MVKTVTDTAIEEKKFLEEAVKILKSLGYSVVGCAEEKIETIIKELGYKKGYKGTWIMPGDFIPDED